MNMLLYLGIIFVTAYAVKALSKRIGLPEVTGYVVLGVLLGGSVSRLLTTNVLDDLQPVASLALGIIAFIIGIELRFKTIRKIGGSILWIVMFEGAGRIRLRIHRGQLHLPGQYGTGAAARLGGGRHRTGRDRRRHQTVQVQGNADVDDPRGRGH